MIRFRSKITRTFRKSRALCSFVNKYTLCIHLLYRSKIFLVFLQCENKWTSLSLFSFSFSFSWSWSCDNVKPPLHNFRVDEIQIHHSLLTCCYFGSAFTIFVTQASISLTFALKCHLGIKNSCCAAPPIHLS